MNGKSFDLLNLDLLLNLYSISFLSLLHISTYILNSLGCIGDALRYDEYI